MQARRRRRPGPRSGSSRRPGARWARSPASRGPRRGSRRRPAPGSRCRQVWARVGEAVETQGQRPVGGSRLQVGELHAVGRYHFAVAWPESSVAHGQGPHRFRPVERHRRRGRTRCRRRDTESGGGRTLRVTFFGVRGSCPCSGRAVRALRRQHVLCGRRGRRRATDRPRPGHRPAAPRARRSRRASAPGTPSRSPPSSPTCTGTTSSASLLHPAAARRGPDGRLRPSAGRWHPARHDRPGREPPVLPRPGERAPGLDRLPRGRRRRFAIGSAKVLVRGCPTWGRRSGSASRPRGQSLAFVSDHQAPDDRTRGGRGGARAVRRSRPGHPRRAVHRGGVRRPRPPGATRPIGVRRARGGRGRGPALALFHHDPGHTDDDIDGLLAEAQATDAASRLDGVLAAAEGLTIDLGRPDS